jgi:hypothetical protein
MIAGPNSLVFVTALLAALATPMLGRAKGKHVNQSTAWKTAAPGAPEASELQRKVERTCWRCPTSLQGHAAHA